MPQNVSSTDDQRVLDELERLRHAIRETRRGPGPAVADGGEVPRLLSNATVRSREGEVPSPAQGTSAPSLARPAAGNPGEPAIPRVSHRSPDVLAGGEPAAATVRSSNRVGILLASLGVTIALWLGWFMLRDPAPAGPVEPAVVSRGAAAPPPAAEPASAPVDPHPVRVDIVTSRPVWMRVTVDGRIAIERMLPQGERLPFGADKSIVVRAGDAGAVSVWIGAVDQGPLGRDGQVVTRRFEAPVR